MTWLLIAVVVWTVVALGLGLLIGRSVRLADGLETVRDQSPVPDFVPVEWALHSPGPSH